MSENKSLKQLAMESFKAVEEIKLAAEKEKYLKKLETDRLEQERLDNSAIVWATPILEKIFGPEIKWQFMRSAASQTIAVNGESNNKVELVVLTNGTVNLRGDKQYINIKSLDQLGERIDATQKRRELEISRAYSD